MMDARSLGRFLVPKRARPWVRRRIASLAEIGGVTSTPHPVDVVFGVPSEMDIDERLFLYALVRGQRPRRMLEIGTARGGSALIITTAMEENGVGCLVSVDPLPQIALDPAAFQGRLYSLSRPSPEGIDEAAEVAGGSFDLILIDGIHIYDQVRKDLAAALPHASDGAYLLFHDAFHIGVDRAIREALEADAGLQDCGYVCNRPRPVGELATHAGFRLLRIGSRIFDPTPLVQDAYRQLRQKPPLDPDLVNHDFWYCEAIKPCAYCEKTKGTASPASALSE
jgi:predicted O-methyltransferase YrrM